MLAAIDISQSLAVKKKNLKDVSIYPNPFSDELTISIGNNELTEIRLIDELGRILTEFIPETVNTLNLGSLANGVYHLLFVNHSGEITAEKVIKR